MPHVGQTLIFNGRPARVVAMTTMVEVIAFEDRSEPAATVIAREGFSDMVAADVQSEVLAALHSCGILPSSPEGKWSDADVSLRDRQMQQVGYRRAQADIRRALDIMNWLDGLK